MKRFAALCVRDVLNGEARIVEGEHWYGTPRGYDLNREEGVLEVKIW